MHKYFQISCHALIITAFIALALTGRLDAPSIVIFSVGVLVSVYRTTNGLPPLLNTRGAFLLSCGYIVFFLFDTVVLSRSFIPASIHLVLFLELAKLLQHKEDKDYLYLIILSFLMVLAASSLTIDMSFVATLFLFLVALVSTLMSFDMHRSERKARVTAQQVAAPLSGMSLWATVWIIITGVGLFFIIPRIGAGYFSRAATQSLLLSGFTESVQLGEIGQVKLSNAVVMRAKQLSGARFSVLKWRGIALDMFDGRNWRRTDRKRFPVRPSPDEQYWLRPIENTGDQVRYELLLEPIATTTLFGPHQIRAVSGRLQGLEMDTDDSIYMRFQSQRRVQYQVLSELPNRKSVFGAAVSDEPAASDVGLKYLQVPRDLDPRIRKLALEITVKANSAIEKASLVEAYLKRNYDYTLNLSWQPGTQPLSTFLFEAKTGHCEYFASSMAILLRAAGIHTRLVNGFLMGEYNPVGNDYIVRQSDAHSWVEVYAPGRGWMEFDPTPPDPNHREMTLALQLSHYVDAMELFWNSYILIYDSGAQLQLFRSAQENVQSAQTTVRRKTERWAANIQIISDRYAARVRSTIETVWFWLLAVALLASGVAFRHRRWLRTRYEIWQLRKGCGTVSEDVVEEMFYLAARLAERRGEKRQPTQTWREWVFRLPDTGRRSILTRALVIFEKSKYGSRQVTAAEFNLLEETIRELKM